MFRQNIVVKLETPFSYNEKNFVMMWLRITHFHVYFHAVNDREEQADAIVQLEHTLISN